MKSIPRLCLWLLTAAAAALADRASAESVALSELGRGVDLRLGDAKVSCVSGSSKLRLDPQGSLSARYGASFEELLSTTRGQLSGGFDLGLFGASAQIDYYARIARSERSSAYLVDFEVKAGDVVLSELELTPAGSAALLLPEAQRRAACGNAFTSSLEVGARLLLGAVLQFANADELQRFETTIRAEALFGLVHSTRSFRQQTASFAETSHLQIVALQQGGQPALLQAVLGGAEGASCPLGAAERCLEQFSSVLEYAARLPEQFGDSYQLGDLSVLSSHETRYEDSAIEGLATLEPATGARAAQSLRRLLKQRADDLNQSARIELLLGLADEQRRARLLGALGALGAHISVLEAAIRQCRTAASEVVCASLEASAALQRSALSPSELDY